MLIPPLPNLSSLSLSHQVLIGTTLLILVLSLAEIFGTDEKGKRTELFIILVPVIGVLSLLVIYQAVSRFL